MVNKMQWQYKYLLAKLWNHYAICKKLCFGQQQLGKKPDPIFPLHPGLPIHELKQYERIMDAAFQFEMEHKQTECSKSGSKM
jgi:hypothetical protein